MKEITTRLISILLLVAIGIIISNKVLFMHTHKAADGSVITHAHPYNKMGDSQPYKSHHHSKIEFQFFQQLDIIFLFLGILYSLISHQTFYKFLRPRADSTSFIITRIVYGRAPPIK